MSQQPRSKFEAKVIQRSRILQAAFEFEEEFSKNSFFGYACPLAAKIAEEVRELRRIEGKAQ